MEMSEGENIFLTRDTDKGVGDIETSCSGGNSDLEGVLLAVVLNEVESC